jgi:hypothetical protein
MLIKCDELEEKLSPQELRDREEYLDELRAYIRRAARNGGVTAQVHPSFPQRAKKTDPRVDMEVITGMACVPDPQ